MPKASGCALVSTASDCDLEKDRWPQERDLGRRMLGGARLCSEGNGDYDCLTSNCWIGG